MKDVPINPEILQWARETSNYTMDEIADKLGKSSETIYAWERGEEYPTYVQLEVMAYRLLKRPIAIFFFPEPPEIDEPQAEFRTLPAEQVNQLSPNVIVLLRQARDRQFALSELFDGQNPAGQTILGRVDADPQMSVAEVAMRVRDRLGVSLREQVSWSSTDEAFDNWREALERAGSFTFKEAFSDDRISGFCLYEPSFPIIYVNNSMPKTRQIFTLFHELSHLLFGTAGIDLNDDAFIEDLEAQARRIEIFCNQFAAEFLVPDIDFDRVISGKGSFDQQRISLLAGRYCVSREVILRKILDRGLIDQERYDRDTARWIEDARQARRDRRGGGNYYATMATYLGHSFLERAFQQYHRRHLSLYELSAMTGVRVENLPRLEQQVVGS